MPTFKAHIQAVHAGTCACLAPSVLAFEHMDPKSSSFRSGIYRCEGPRAQAGPRSGFVQAPVLPCKYSQACRLLKKRWTTRSGAELGRLRECRVRGRHGSGRAELYIRPKACAAMAMAVSQDEVRAKLGELLEKADLSTVSERTLLNSLVSHFGEEVRTVHKQLVKVATPYRPPCAAQ